jgi:excisionase family DNA binding protein
MTGPFLYQNLEVLLMQTMYTVEQIAKNLQVRKAFVYELIVTGRLRAVRLSERRFRITENALQEFLEKEEASTRENYVVTGTYI